METNFISISDLGRRWGMVYMALYRATKWVTAQELADLAQQDLKVVETVLGFLQKQGWVTKLAASDKWAYAPHARMIIEALMNSQAQIAFYGAPQIRRF